MLVAGVDGCSGIFVGSFITLLYRQEISEVSKCRVYEDVHGSLDAEE